MTTNKTRNILEKASATQLQEYIWPEGMPQWLPRYSKSPELMTIFYILLLDQLDGVRVTSRTLDAEIYKLFNASTRDVVRYRAVEDFKLEVGTLQEHIDLPRYVTLDKVRQVRAGNTLLLRLDSQDGTAELQILQNGLFGPDDEVAIFDLTFEEFATYTKFLIREQRLID